jgi:2-(1,2-epoxy-1,2-dihydrophenyl)acetyl-CoA isomerase
MFRGDRLVSELVDVSLGAGIARVRLNDPASLNAMGFTMAHDLRATFERLAADDAVRVVILEGAGGNFSSGGHLKDALACAAEGPAGASRFMANFNAMLLTVFNFPKPIIGLGRGVAAGGALGLLLCTDIILLARSARLIQAFIHVGLAPDCGTSLLLARRVGIGRAKELTLTGRRVEAEEALDMGLCDALHADEEIDERAQSLARSIAIKSPLATAHTKQIMQSGQFATLPAALDMEAAVQIVLMQGADFREGVQAFMEKRPPAVG